MTLHHLHGDDSGATQLTTLGLVSQETPVGTVVGLRGIPVKALDMAQFVPKLADLGHKSTRRQFFVVLAGVLEVETSLGHTERLDPGDVLLADDVDTDGHSYRDVSDESLLLMAIEVDPSWQLPAEASAPA